jgi:hypothetical protein
MKMSKNVSDGGLVPFPVWCEVPACHDMGDRQPSTEDANAALLAWYRRLAAERVAPDEIVKQSPNESAGPETPAVAARARRRR